MTAQINNKLDQIIGVLMDHRKPVDRLAQLTKPSSCNGEEHAAQLAQILKNQSTFETRSQQAAIQFAQLLAAMATQLEKVQGMSQALLDAVGALAGNVQTLTTRVAEHDATMQSLIAALQTALAANPGTAQDPDIARAIDAISQASASVAQSADTINAETQKMAAAVVPPASPSPAPAVNQPAADA